MAVSSTRHTLVDGRRFSLSRAAAVTLIILWVAVAALGATFVPGITQDGREMIAYSQIIPILIAAFYFGQAGGLLVAFVASLVSGSLVIRHIDAINTLAIQRVMFQITSFNVVALLTSFLSDQEKTHRAKVSAQLERITALRAIDRAINAGTDLSATLYLLIENLTRFLEAEAAVIYLRDHETGCLMMKASLGFGGDLWSTAEDVWRAGAEEAAREGRAIHHPDLSLVNRAWADRIQGEGVVAYHAVPLVARDEVQGVLEIYDRASHPDETWRNDLETLAGQAAIAIVNSQLVENLKRTNGEMVLAYDATLRGWSRALDLRDHETEGHTQRVVAHSVRLAERMGLAGEQLLSFQRGAILHDIGKMGVPDSILLKPGPLTESEWAVMRKHPMYAQLLLAPIKYLESALIIPLYHHERWDGSGYPFGLRGQDIPVEARIFAVADVWDALRSDRPYRSALDEADCIAHITDCAGRLYDPAVVEVFLAMLAEERRSPETPSTLTALPPASAA